MVETYDPAEEKISKKVAAVESLGHIIEKEKILAVSLIASILIAAMSNLALRMLILGLLYVYFVFIFMKNTKYKKYLQDKYNIRK